MTVNDLVSYAGGCVANGRISQPGQVGRVYLRSRPPCLLLGVRVISQSRKNTSLLRKQNNRIHDRTRVFIPILLINVNKLATDLREWTVLEVAEVNGKIL
jgi:hypothetical protein